jgi:hypothetical protein
MPAHEFKIDVATAIDPLVRAASLGERVKDEAVPMNRIAGAGTLGPFGLSRENVNPHCVEDLGIVGHGNLSVSINRREFPRSRRFSQ